MPLSSKASYKKLAGVIQLTDSYLQWTQDGKSAPSIRVPHSQAASLSRSKDGAARVALKITLLNEPPGAGHNFTFTAEPQPKALAERDAFQNELLNIIANNRSTTTPTAQSTPAPTLASASARNGGAVPPRATPALSARTSAATPMSRATSVVADGRSTTPFGADSAAEFRLRKNVLLANPDLANLHKELVMSGQINEADFWEGRSHLLAAQSAFEAQRKGRPGQLVDPRPQTVDGNTKIVITPQLVHDIFEEYPVVAKAYSEVVPDELKEEEFWTRYFQSKLFETHRASIRSAAAQHVVRNDPIFDKYLEKDDDELEPRRMRADGVDTFINLGASAEDHGETGNEKDITMQAGRQRATLPLIRKFNEHSERLLKATMGDEPPAKRRRLGESEIDRMMELDLDDLHDPEASTNIVLEMKEQQRYFEGQSAADVNGHSVQKPSLPLLKRDAVDNLEGWTDSLAQLKLDRKSGEAAMTTMTQNVAARMESKLRKNDLPVSLFRQMTTCQTAANEFLRQFWFSIYPPATDAPPAGGAAAAATQRKQKAAKMAEYLAKTPEKVEALIRTAKREGADFVRVDIAMRPILDAVNHALAFHRSRQAAPSRR